MSDLGGVVAAEPTLMEAVNGHLERLRILHVLDHSVPIHSGYSFRTLALLREQRRFGWHTTHLTTPKHTAVAPPKETVDGFEFHRMPPLPAQIARLPVVKEIAQIHAVAKRIEEVAQLERVQLLHAHSPVLNVLACFAAARRLRVPVVYEIRGFWEDAAVSHGTATAGGPRYRVTRALETYAIRRCDAVAVICQGIRDDIVARGIPDDHISLVPNGVDIEAFSARAEGDAALRASLGFEKKIVLGFLGSFYAYEGLDLLLSALPIIRRQRSDVVILLAGGGPEEEALKEQVQRGGLSDVVRFVGQIPHAQIQRYYDLVDIFVYPRHRMRLTETVTPLKPLEAMARGGIVLASDVGGHRELVSDGDTGALFRADDVDDLARMVLRVVAHQEQWPTIRLRARKYVENERTWHMCAANYRELYLRALRAQLNKSKI